MFGSFDDALLEKKVTQLGHAVQDELQQPGSVQAGDALGTEDELQQQPGWVKAGDDALGTGGGLRDGLYGGRGGRGADQVDGNAAGRAGGRRWWWWLQVAVVAAVVAAAAGHKAVVTAAKAGGPGISSSRAAAVAPASRPSSGRVVAVVAPPRPSVPKTQRPMSSAARPQPAGTPRSSKKERN